MANRGRKAKVLCSQIFTQTDYRSKICQDLSKITNILPVSQIKGFLFLLNMHFE